jgi:PTH1 family peptidyl-tRNA hydrolase
MPVKMDKNITNKKIIVIGIGNPGKEFENTYHNVGIIAVDKIIQNEKEKNEFTVEKWKEEKTFSYTKYENIIFAKSKTFMNESGMAVSAIVKTFNIPKENIIVIHDDSDILIGNMKISFDKSSAGHKGVQSIINALLSKRFLRFRIGTRPENEKLRKKAGDFALNKIKSTDSKKLELVIEKIENEIETIINNPQKINLQ